MKLQRTALLFLATSVLVAPAAAVAQVATSDGAIERLRPGEFLWAPDIAPAGPVTIVVSLPAQRAFVYRNGVPIGVSTVSTGKPGHATPTGVFTILQKKRDHTSNLYANAPMPFMQRLTWDGVALHGGRLPGYPASHGCVRLPLDFAKRLFEVTSLGLTVIITDERDVPEVAPGAVAPFATPADDHRPPQRYEWRPERAPAGPVSIVVSGRDRRIVVLRNGIRIGSSPVSLDAPVDRTEAFTLVGVEGETPRWLRLPLPMPPGAQATSPARTGEITPEERARGHVPDGFRRAVLSILTPGATMLVTRDTLASSGTGRRLRVLEIDR